MTRTHETGELGFRLRCNFGIVHGAATSLFVFTSRYSTEKRRAVAALFYPAIRAKPKNG